MTQLSPITTAYTTDTEFARIDHLVKLIVWDLDDTFWRGTLSEGSISLIQSNIDMVRTLAERGIISSICSKNDFNSARAELVKCGMWEYFVFSKIDFTPKGARVAALIEEMNLRAENVLFIDDNVMNLREVQFVAPSVMAVHPDAVLGSLLDNNFLKGKPDKELNRLHQYKQLEQKLIDQASDTLSNEDFLRQCSIRVKFIYDLEPHIDRLIDLINRSNQLNYTKRRIAESERHAFVEQLRGRNVYAAAVTVADRYGDYGIVGFFFQNLDPLSFKLEHFVFSCRIMHMGIEQYVYQHIGSPPIEIVDPVANNIVSFDNVDWISADGDTAISEGIGATETLLLVGGCDLLQVASYLSKNRIEYVNDVRENVVIRYDDFGFILNNRHQLEVSPVLPQIPCWTAPEALTFDRQLEDADIVLISFWVALRGRYLTTADGLVVRVHPYGLGEYFDRGAGKPFLDQVEFHKLTPSENATLLESAILQIAARSTGARRILVGANTRVIDSKTPKEDREQRELYNTVCKRLAAKYDGLNYVDIDTIIDRTQMVDEWHYTRLGYLQLAEEIKRRLAAMAVSAQVPATTAQATPIFEVVRRARRVRKSGHFGPPRQTGAKLKNRIIRKLDSYRIGSVALWVAKFILGRGASRS